MLILLNEDTSLLHQERKRGTKNDYQHECRRLLFHGEKVKDLFPCEK